MLAAISRVKFALAARRSRAGTPRRSNWQSVPPHVPPAPSHCPVVLAGNAGRAETLGFPHPEPSGRTPCCAVMAAAPDTTAGNTHGSTAPRTQMTRPPARRDVPWPARNAPRPGAGYSSCLFQRVSSWPNLARQQNSIYPISPAKTRVAPALLQRRFRDLPDSRPLVLTA